MDRTPAPLDPVDAAPEAGDHSDLSDWLLPGALFVTAAFWALALLPTQVDVVIYRRYAEALLHQPLSQALPHEYPALAGVVFLLPRLLPLAYPVALALLMAIAFGLLVWAGRSLGRPWVLRFTLYAAAADLGVAFARYDLLVALAILLAVRSARQGRWGGAWAWALLGTLLKLFPILLIPGFALAERHRTGHWPLRRAAALIAVLGLWALVQWVVAPGTLFNPLRYETSRGFEFSSLPGTLTLLVAPSHLHWGTAYYNLQISGGGTTAIQAAVGVLGVAALTAMWTLAYRRPVPIETVSLAVLSAAVLTNKSLAPQYLLWLAPLWAMWRLQAPLVGAAILTTVAYPILFVFPDEFNAALPYLALTIVAAARNLLLAWGSLDLVLRGVRSAREEAPGTTPGQPGDTRLLPAS